MRAEFEESWTEREEAWTAVRGALAGGYAFRVLRKTRRRLRKVMQAAEGRYQEVYAGELEEFAKRTQEVRMGISKAGVGCRVRRWKARSTSGTRMEYSIGSSKKFVRVGTDISLHFSIRPWPLSTEQLFRVDRPNH